MLPTIRDRSPDKISETSDFPFFLGVPAAVFSSHDGVIKRRLSFIVLKSLSLLSHSAESSSIFSAVVISPFILISFLEIPGTVHNV